MTPKTKKKISKEEFDEFGWRIIGDEDEKADVIVTDHKKAASQGCKSSNTANKSLVAADATKSEEEK